GKNEAVEVDQAVVEQKGLVGFDHSRFTAVPRFPFLALLVDDRASEFVALRTEPFRRRATEDFKMRLFEELPRLCRRGDDQWIGDRQTGQSRIRQYQLGQAERVNGRQPEPAVVRDAELSQPGKQLADARVAIGDTSQALRRPYFLGQQSR